ncbi:hypothetical protein MIND_00255600 [Mycena indigotica]|uniref:Uncharacterized protein n=1 Tax=Mycena indigotica TaxID=2126181 RepID=A0A8H6WDE8_9AGAR|nr:uncharacterized protein MIND_00255600 [Mycena indigotica]KAF7312421.1 hypothetical protein MIND_00255600 [Mycena indigotica]
MDPSSSSSTVQPQPRPEAGPLPTKRGEIGYDESARAAESTTPNNASPLPERHPEDRDATTSAVPSTPTSNPAASVSTSSLPNSTTKKPKRILGIFSPPKKIPTYAGLRATTLAMGIFQCFLIAATIVGWYFTASRVGRTTSASASQSSDSQQQMLGGASSVIFIHVVFGVATLVQLLFVERRVFKLRAQRYSHLHPGEILPSARRRQMGEYGSDPVLALSPWNRPPLPTYAAALAQSGVGTGDAEDHLIAAPPPPAYGNTRGSTFLLSGFLRESLRAQRPTSAHSTAAMSQRTSRPLSYKSVDENWLEIQDADRARQLEETLARLEAPAPAVTRS